MNLYDDEESLEGIILPTELPDINDESVVPDLNLQLPQPQRPAPPGPYRCHRMLVLSPQPVENNWMPNWHESRAFVPVHSRSSISGLRNQTHQSEDLHQIYRPTPYRYHHVCFAPGCLCISHHPYRRSERQDYAFDQNSWPRPTSDLTFPWQTAIWSRPTSDLTFPYQTATELVDNDRAVLNPVESNAVAEPKEEETSAGASQSPHSHLHITEPTDNSRYN